MIKNSHEFNITNKMIDDFSERLSQLTSIKKPSEMVINEIFAIDIILKDLKNQIKWYIDTVNNKLKFDTLRDLKELPSVITGRRLQLGFSQEDLARQIGISADEYLFLDDNDFYGITPDIFVKIISTLKIENPNKILAKNYINEIDKVENNLKSLKISKTFISQIMPINFDLVKGAIKKRLGEACYLFERFIEIFKKSFSIDLREDISKDTYPNAFAVAFKRRVNANIINLNFITSFAAHVALIFAKQLEFKSNILRADPITIRQAILDFDESLSLEACIEFIWNLNIAVLPLDIKSGFHGACFDFEDKKIITLNQQVDTVSHWKFDLLHELYHALTMDYDIYIERTDIMEQNEGDEKDASDFANFVIFGQEVDSFVKIVLERSEGNAQLIKSAIVSVSEEYGLNIDDFSNYVAYRFSKQSLSFWGVASNLQNDKRSAKEVVRNILLRKINYGVIDNDDLFIIQRALLERVIL